jgi:hypothetical protein
VGRRREKGLGQHADSFARPFLLSPVRWMRGMGESGRKHGQEGYQRRYWSCWCSWYVLSSFLVDIYGLTRTLAYASFFALPLPLILVIWLVTRRDVQLAEMS